jgi:integrase/recombinase XerD
LNKAPARESLQCEPLLRSFERHLKAEGKRQPTIDHYIGSSRQFAVFAEDEHLPPLVNVTREHVEMWLEQLHLVYKPHSVRNRFIGLRIFFRWLAQEGEIERDPTTRIKTPAIDEVDKDVVSPADMDRVLTYLEKKKRYRDAALIAILYDTGMRASEVAELRTDEVNLDTRLIVITKTKNHRTRVVKLSPTGVRYVDRYLRHFKTEPEYLIQGTKGKMTRSGVYWTVRHCFEECNVKGRIGAHDLRHTSASHVVGDMSESAMMALYGWSDPEMARHYARQALEKAALEAHDRASPLERLRKKRDAP